MRQLIVTEFMSLDGVVQSPIYADEDPSGGFAHGGWHTRYLDDAAMKWIIDNVSQAGGYVFGRRTYKRFAAHWPRASAQEQALAVPMNTLPKYVASRTLKEPLGWQHSQLLKGDVVEAVGALKSQSGKYLLCIGSSELVQTLIACDLVDELRLMIDPVLLGGGKRWLRDDGERKMLKLVNSEVTSSGAMLATYSRDDR